jgi:hypothetical protein
VNRTLFANDASGMPLLVTFQHFRFPLGEWVNVRQEAITYNEAGLQVERIMRHWFPEAQDWGNRHRLLFGYDTGLNLDTLLGQVWIPHLQAWMNKSLDDFEYDPDGTLLSRLTQVWHPFHEKWVNFRLMELVLDLKHTVAGTSTLPGNHGLLTLSYPNPFRAGNMINVRGQENGRIRVDLYQLNATRVSSMEVSADSPFSLESRLAPGLYIIRASAGQECVSGKILLLD